MADGGTYRSPLPKSPTLQEHRTIAIPLAFLIYQLCVVLSSACTLRTGSVWNAAGPVPMWPFTACLVLISYR